MTDIRKKFTSDPQTIQEAMSRSDWPKWKEAIKSEFGSFERNQNWNEVMQADIPTEEKVVRSRFVFLIKYNAQGEIVRYSTKCYMKGFYIRIAILY